MNMGVQIQKRHYSRVLATVRLPRRPRNSYTEGLNFFVSTDSIEYSEWFSLQSGTGSRNAGHPWVTGYQARTGTTGQAGAATSDPWVACG